LITRKNPAALDQQGCQGALLARGPERAGLDELMSVNQTGLKSEHAEEEIPISVHGRLQVLTE
jgi:hypothetical protein